MVSYWATKSWIFGAQSKLLWFDFTHNYEEHIQHTSQRPLMGLLQSSWAQLLLSFSRLWTQAIAKSDHRLLAWSTTKLCMFFRFSLFHELEGPVIAQAEAEDRRRRFARGCIPRGKATSHAQSDSLLEDEDVSTADNILLYQYPTATWLITPVLSSAFLYASARWLRTDPMGRKYIFKPLCTLSIAVCGETCIRVAWELLYRRWKRHPSSENFSLIKE